MGKPQTRNASTNDSNDPLNYPSFDDFVAGASRAWSLQGLAERWNQTHPDEPVQAYHDFIVPPSHPTPEAFVDCGKTRVFAALQLIGGGLEVFVAGGALLAPEPTGVTKVVGAVVLLHGVDTLQAAARTILTCDRTATVTQASVTSVALSVGASPASAQTIGVITDVGIGVGGSFAVGTLARIGAGGGQLVHLTNASSAAAIRGTQALGLGRSTLYAGPQALAKARGWSILARTGLLPSQASEVIVLPSRANSAFLVVQPFGPFSAWQRLSGTVFSSGTGVLNLTTGAFTRTGVAVNQLGIYGLDGAIMASVRVAPGVTSATTAPR